MLFREKLSSVNSRKCIFDNHCIYHGIMDEGIVSIVGFDLRIPEGDEEGAQRKECS